MTVDDRIRAELWRRGYQTGLSLSREGLRPGHRVEWLAAHPAYIAGIKAALATGNSEKEGEGEA